MDQGKNHKTGCAWYEMKIEKINRTLNALQEKKETFSLVSTKYEKKVDAQMQDLLKERERYEALMKVRHEKAIKEVREYNEKKRKRDEKRNERTNRQILQWQKIRKQVKKNG